MTTTGNSDLDVAVSTAREAGELLRGEFLRPGGPRGHGGHAEIDRPVEDLIRRRLLAARPEYAYLGEETGAAEPNDAEPSGAEPSRPRWIVDPNDGTSEFLKGARGPSVSIALVVAGRPVLGVVYAYAAPDDRGDLICGGEELGLWRGLGVEGRTDGYREPIRFGRSGGARPSGGFQRRVSHPGAPHRQ